MDIEIVSKELSIIKPVEQRIVGLASVFVPLFEWQEKSLKNLQAILETEDLDGLVATEDIGRLKEMSDAITRFRSLAKSEEKDRKEYTSSFDKIKKRMMTSEEAYELIAKKIETPYILLKRKADKIAKEKQDKLDEIANFRAKMEFEFNRQVSAYNLYIQSKITEVYTEALELIEVEDIKPYLEDLKGKHTERSFNWAIPTCTLEQQPIMKEVFSKWNAKQFSDKFMSDLNQTFSDFEIAKRQKEEAIESRKMVVEVEVEIIKEVEETNNTIAFLDSKSETSVYEHPIQMKEIKKSWAVKMDHNWDTMTLIERAFFANRRAAIPLYTGKDPWKIDTEQKAALLAKLKNKDSVFAPEGIVFEEIEKI